MQSLKARVRLLTLGAAGLFLFSAVALFGQAPSGPGKGPVQKKELQGGGPNGGQKIQGKQAPPVGDPVAVKTKEGKVGWKVVIPGNHPLATPAVADGKVFIGGGFGSYEFYAFDAKTGKEAWLYPTGDDGPTAAVVEGGYIAFNTESCELEIITMDGKPVWKKRLGDPLMSMPAISKGKVYMAYPDSNAGNQHKLACFDVKTGKEYWTKNIAGDIITAPVIQDDKIFLTTLEGTMYCFHEQDGSLAWSEKKNATSSPAVHNGKVYFSQRFEKTVKDKSGKEVAQQMECLSGRGIAKKDEILVLSGTERKADYLDFKKRAAMSPVEGANKNADAGVGFAGGAPAGKLGQAQYNLGQGTVAGVWSYQGSRPFVYKDMLISSMGDVVKCVNMSGDKVQWKKELHPTKPGEAVLDCGVTPPAVVNGKIFVGTSKGEIICLSAETGDELWRATLGEPIVFQPAVANGRVYASSNRGTLFCIETGDANDHGWLMWGGNAQHNGAVK
jgi:Ca-activated chloride channel family protein